MSAGRAALTPAMAGAEFGSAPGSSPGLEVWRIESMAPVPVAPKLHGRFHEGDAYIVLRTARRGAALSWEIFFWLGKECSHDEQGVAAYKSVELDDALGGAPVQHRETQGHESKLFLSCFKRVEYLKGGVVSGFRHVE